VACSQSATTQPCDASHSCGCSYGEGIGLLIYDLGIEKRKTEPGLIDLGETVSEALKDVFKDLDEVSDLGSDGNHYE
jgi:hypothetical protein